MRSKVSNLTAAKSYLLDADKVTREIIDALDKAQIGGLMEKAVTIRHHILTAIELITEEEVLKKEV